MDAIEIQKLIESDGFAIIPSVFGSAEVSSILENLQMALHRSAAGVMGRDRGVYAARNVLDLWPEVRRIWCRAPLPVLLSHILGPDFGLVRVLYFDKPPGQSWSLPWHKDLVIAVRDNSLPTQSFTHPTTKAGVPHLEAPVDVLESMLTLRIHLDEITQENGPIKVAPGSHKTGKSLAVETCQPRTILVRQGDVLLIRPLVSHASSNAAATTARHRRILHFEFAAQRELRDGVEWHDFWRSR